MITRFQLIAPECPVIDPEMFLNVPGKLFPEMCPRKQPARAKVRVR